MAESRSLSDRERQRIFTCRIVEFLQHHGRDYPWRRTRDPYKILIAEIMLQRTKSDQVVTVYEEFIRKFPDSKSLAKASPREIRQMLGSLGLRWRAEKVVSLSSAFSANAQVLQLKRKDDLLALPGVGTYVADAILCYAYGKKVVPIDSNVCRVLGRIFDLHIKGEARRSRLIRDRAKNLSFPESQTREFNWGLLDFAASICTPVTPKCPSCTLNSICLYPEKTSFQ